MTDWSARIIWISYFSLCSSQCSIIWHWCALSVQLSDIHVDVHLNMCFFSLSSWTELFWWCVEHSRFYNCSRKYCWYHSQQATSKSQESWLTSFTHICQGDLGHLTLLCKRTRVPLLLPPTTNFILFSISNACGSKHEFITTCFFFPILCG